MEKNMLRLLQAVHSTRLAFPSFSFSRRTQQHKDATPLRCAFESCLRHSNEDDRNGSLRTPPANIGSPVSEAEERRQNWREVARVPAEPQRRPSSIGIDRCNCTCGLDAARLRSLDSTNANKPDCAA